MIPLDSPRWSEITCTRGPATRVPELLRAVYAQPHAGERDAAWEEVWGELWDLVCHQGTISSASFATVPHLVEAGLKASPGILHWCIFGLPVEIEKSRLGHNIFRSTRPPEEIDPGYFDAILRLEDLCARTAEWGRDADLSKAVGMARRLLSKRRGNILPKQRPHLGPLFDQ
jgi:hypothetical protein